MYRCLCDTVGKKDGNLLSNTSKEQIGMECCRIEFSVGNAKTVLKMVDRLFNHYADLYVSSHSSVPLTVPGKTRKLFQGRYRTCDRRAIRTWVLAQKCGVGTSILAFLPGHLGADELECWSAATKDLMCYLLASWEVMGHWDSMVYHHHSTDSRV